MRNPGSCPVCDAPNSHARLFLDENIDSSKISEFSYSSRKQPEFMCYRLNQCLNCDLVYVSAPPAPSDLAESYHIASYDSSEEANDAAQSYIEVLKPILAQLSGKQRVLEIGSGTGILLEHLRNEGFEELVGIEPSHAAIAAAPSERRAWLREGIFNENDYEPQSFDLICCFMTMEHVYDPLATAIAAKRLLRHGGAFVTITHDYRSFVNRLLGARSPIIDIEHLQLFSDHSIKKLFRQCGYANISARPFKNCYSLRYWLRLAPLPGFIKQLIQRSTTIIGVEKAKIAFNVGNTVTVGFVD